MYIYIYIYICLFHLSGARKAMSALKELGPQLAATILAQLNRLGGQAPLHYAITYYTTL